MIVYWYLFSNHYTRECIHTCERERTCGSSQSSPGFVLAPSSWCRHALHAHHPPSPPCLVSSQAGFGMQCYSPLQTRTLGPPWSVRGLLMKSYLNLIHVRPSRLLVFVVGACPCCLPRGCHHCSRRRRWSHFPQPSHAPRTSDCLQEHLPHYRLLRALRSTSHAPHWPPARQTVHRLLEAHRTLRAALQRQVAELQAQLKIYTDFCSCL